MTGPSYDLFIVHIDADRAWVDGNLIMTEPGER
jgi:hypothetical protein